MRSGDNDDDDDDDYGGGGGGGGGGSEEVEDKVLQDLLYASADLSKIVRGCSTVNILFVTFYLTIL